MTPPHRTISMCQKPLKILDASAFNGILESSGITNASKQYVQPMSATVISISVDIRIIASMRTLAAEHGQPAQRIISSIIGHDSLRPKTFTGYLAGTRNTHIMLHNIIVEHDHGHYVRQRWMACHTSLMNIQQVNIQKYFGCNLWWYSKHCKNTTFSAKVKSCITKNQIKSIYYNKNTGIHFFWLFSLLLQLGTSIK